MRRVLDAGPRANLRSRGREEAREATEWLVQEVVVNVKVKACIAQHTQSSASSTRLPSPTEQHSGRRGSTLHGAGPVAVLEQRIRLKAVRVLSCTAQH